MTAVCPAGHTSTADDYCDVCGMPIDAAAQGAQQASQPTVPPAAHETGQPAGSAGQPCPHCGTENSVDALFCENCGYDFTTNSLPRSEDPAPAGPEGPPPPDDAPGAAPAGGAADETAVRPVPVAGDSRSLAPNLPFRWVAEVWIDPSWYDAQDSPDPLPSPGLPLVVPLRHTSVLVGRLSQSRNIHPDIDCGTDSGVSRRQAQLTSDGTRWFVEDLESANGTFVGPASGALPTDPISVGSKAELRADDRIYVGAWTRLVIREATEDELTSLG